MTLAADARFWNRSARKYARGAIADPQGYERTLERTCGLLKAGDRVLELGCGTGTTALRLAPGAGAYLATDISAQMIAIAGEKLAAEPLPGLAFRTATVEDLATEAGRFEAALGFNYLHLVRDLAGALTAIHGLLAPSGLFISKTPCVGDMSPLLALAVPPMRALGLAPYVRVFRAGDLSRAITAAGFEVLAVETHASKGDDHRPFIVARRA